MIEVTIDSVRIGLMNRKPEYQYVVLLRERSSKRYLPIFIGQAEARAILIKLKNETVPRPMTHDLILEIIENVFDATIDNVIINSLENDIFFAKINVGVDSHQYVIDSRPSDALALALRGEAPIFVEEGVLDKAGIALDRDKETDDLVVDSTDELEAEEKSRKVSEEEIKRLGVFREFIDTLDLEDFGKNKS